MKKENKKKRNKTIKIIVITIAVLFFGSIFITWLLWPAIKDRIIADEYPPLAKKPIIYLYPEKEQEVTIKVNHPDNFTTTYPKYNDGWKVMAKPDGTLIDQNGRSYYSLYWEGNYNKNNKIKEDGFVVKGKDTIKFLEEKLFVLGLNEREANEFIIYWLPKLENNKYNYIRFQTMEEINDYMKLDINPKPDTLIRVLMEYKPLDKKIKVKEQKLTTIQRHGFSVVEWGGTNIN